MATNDRYIFNVNGVDYGGSLQDFFSSAILVNQSYEGVQINSRAIGSLFAWLVDNGHMTVREACDILGTPELRRPCRIVTQTIKPQ